MISRHISCGQLVCLTDVFATCAQLSGLELPGNAAEDSVSFLPSLTGAASSDRTTLVNHSNMGEFAFRDGPWKLVFKMSDANLDRSRGKPTIAELYRLDKDIAESTDVAAQYPEQVIKMTEALQRLIDLGASRADARGKNDAHVSFHITQTMRWAASTE